MLKQICFDIVSVFLNLRWQSIFNFYFPNSSKQIIISKKTVIIFSGVAVLVLACYEGDPGSRLQPFSGVAV